jgi:pimeloyl-ACP methyl ester carboxylesterase
VQRRTIVVDGLVTHFVEAGTGPPLVLLHGGEFGASAELCWEQTIEELAAHHRVIAPDLLGFGATAKVADFQDGRGMRIRHLARFCAVMDLESADFAGNSLGGTILLTDTSSERPLLPVRRMAVLCGGRDILDNRYSAALFEYDATLEGMRRIVEALFHQPAYPADEDYVRRRYESSVMPGAWEAVAAARFRRPGAESDRQGRGKPPYERIAVPALVVEGADDKLKPHGWAATIAAEIPDGRAATIQNAGHCPQIEQPALVIELLLDHFA